MSTPTDVVREVGDPQLEANWTAHEVPADVFLSFELFTPKTGHVDAMHFDLAITADQAARRFGLADASLAARLWFWRTEGGHVAVEELGGGAFVHLTTGLRVPLELAPRLLGRALTRPGLAALGIGISPPEAPPVVTVEGRAASYTTVALFEDYVAGRKAQKRSDGTISYIKTHAKTVVKGLPPLARDITHERLLGPALRQAYRSELFLKDPKQVIPQIPSLAKACERWLTFVEAWQICEWLARRSPAGRDHAACVAFAVATGAEKGAWDGARRADVRADVMGARVRGKKRTTRDRFAPAPLPEQQRLLKFAMEHARGTAGALFTGRWSTTNANSDLREACAALGIERCSTNDLRRSYASHLGQAGVRDELIEKAMGHKGNVLARHYRKLSDDDLLRLMLECINGNKPPSPPTGAPAAPVPPRPPMSQGAGQPLDSGGALVNGGASQVQRPETATEKGGGPTDGPIAQLVELRTFNP